MSGWDAIVVGAGPNGLTTAALLAKAGRRVLLLERAGQVGGRAAPVALGNGDQSFGLLHDATGVRPWVVRDLELKKHGLRLAAARPPLLILGADGESLLLPGDPAGAARALGGADGQAYGRYRAFLDRIGPVLRAFVDEPPVDLTDVESLGVWELAKRALRVRRLGRRDMMELLRLPPMCVGDWLDEWFRSDLLKLALALRAVAGTWTGPRSPGSNFSLLLWEAVAGPAVEGGAPALVAALRAAAEAAGVTVRTGATVERIDVRDGRATGVRLQGGEEAAAPLVAAACDPKRLFLEMMPPGAVATRLQHRMENFRARGTTAQVLLALRECPRFAAAPDARVEHVVVGDGPRALEQAFDAVKYRRASEAPVLELLLRAGEERRGVVSVLVHYAPYERQPAWDAGARERLGDRVVEILERQAPGLAGSVSARRVLAPPDLEEHYGLTGGHLHHGEHALDQLLIRPVPECARYRSPVEGLYLCGAGAHPGGWLTCAPGAHAAAAILEGR